MRRETQDEHARILGALRETGVLRPGSSRSDEQLMVYAWQAGARPSRVIGNADVSAVPAGRASERGAEIVSALEARLDATGQLDPALLRRRAPALTSANPSSA